MDELNHGGSESSLTAGNSLSDGPRLSGPADTGSTFSGSSLSGSTFSGPADAGKMPGTQGIGATGQQSDWRDTLPADWAERLADVASAEDAMQALERGLAYRPAERAEDIRLEFPEELRGQVDEGVRRHFCELCVREGITPTQAQALLDWQLGANRELLDRLVEDGTRALRESWGSRFEENRASALRTFMALDRRMGGELSESMTGKNMANDPVFVRAFHEIGRLLSEDTLSGGSSAAPSDGRESAEDTYKGMFRGE